MAKFMERTGRELVMKKAPGRTTSGSSWSEEVEMAKNLEIPEAVEEAAGDEDDDDQAQFEMEQDDDVGHRAAGSAGPSSA